jgi:chemotaxis protein methyltransferase CheR
VKATLAEIAALVHRESGIRIADGQHNALRTALDRVEPDADASGFLWRAADPVSGPSLVSRLLDEVTIKETFFLRDKAQLERIEWHSLLDGARAAGFETVRVWSAGCATGEEVYSLALLASEAFGVSEPPVTILGTDISGAALARARQGEYRERSVREIDVVHRRRYFVDSGDRLVVGDRLRSLVTFSPHNLTRDPIPPLGAAPFDLVLCRNVLIYFDAETVARVVESLERAVVAGTGLLVLGAADALSGTAGRLRSLAVTPTRTPPTRRRTLRRPLARRPTDARPTFADGVASGDSEELIGHTSRVLLDDPLNAGASFLRGLAELERGDVEAAIVSLRRVLYTEPNLGLAAFQLGRAYESYGNPAAARRAYEQALRTLDSPGDLQELLLEHMNLADVESAARTRLKALGSAAASA